MSRKVDLEQDKIKEREYQCKVYRKGCDYYDDYESDDPYYDPKR